MSLKLTLS